MTDLFLDAMRQAGLYPPPKIIADGHIHRFSTNGEKRDTAGYYVLHLDNIPAGMFGDWRSGVQRIWSARNDIDLPAERCAQLEGQSRNAKAEREAEQQSRHAKGAIEAKRIWDAAQSAPADHPYLARKQVQPHGARIATHPHWLDVICLLIPVMAGSNMISVQYIPPEKGQVKLFLKGARSKGGYFIIGEVRQRLYIATGFATAATVREETGQSVAVVFGDDNIMAAAKALRALYPDIEFTVCADDDWKREGNPAVKKATAAAKATNSKLAIPTFIDEVRKDDDTDFNDMRLVVGGDKVRERLAAAEFCVEPWEGPPELDPSKEKGEQHQDGTNRDQHDGISPDPDALRRKREERRRRIIERVAWDGIKPESFGRYVMEKTGLHYVSGKQGEETREWICSPFHILRRERDPSGKGWGSRIEWVDADRRRHDYLAPDAMLFADSGVLCGELANGGLKIAVDKRALFIKYLNFLFTKKRATLVHKTGWHCIDDQWVFALPHVTIGNVSEVTVQGAKNSPYLSAGSLQDWQTGVGRLAKGHQLVQFSLSCGCVGPMLRLKPTIGSGGFHFYGESSIGKTSLLCSAASLWGIGREKERGFIEPWHGTSTSFESIAALRSGTLIPLDEVQRARSDDLGSAVYMLAAGTGKRRGDREAALKSASTWEASILSTGEMTIVDKIRHGGQKSYAGQEVRIIDIKADQEQGVGVFNDGDLGFDPKRLADEIKEASVTNFGTAGPAFVKCLIDYGEEKTIAFIDDMRNRFAGVVDLKGATPQVERVADRFALVAAAGELAIQFEIVPWHKNDVLNAAAHLFSEWLKSRGSSNVPAEIRDAIDHIRQMIIAHGSSRFDPADERPERPVVNRLGWARGEGAERQWFILPATWKKDFCQGANAAKVADALHARGMLIRDPDGRHLAKNERIQGDTQRVYVLTSAVLGEPEGSAG
jgi:putative DNA primase/helicase